MKNKTRRDYLLYESDIQYLSLLFFVLNNHTQKNQTSTILIK